MAYAAKAFRACERNMVLQLDRRWNVERTSGRRFQDFTHCKISHQLTYARARLLEYMHLMMKLATMTTREAHWY
jgi:hypothetical protein